MARAQADDNDHVQLLNNLAAAREELNAVQEELNELNAEKKRMTNEIKEFARSHPIDLNDKKYLDYSLLTTALNHRDIGLIKYLIDRGFRVYKKSNSNNKQTVLHAAIGLENADLIKTLLTKGAFPDILALDEQSKTPFHLAIEKNQLSTIKLFLSHYDAKTFEEKCLLHYAVEMANIQVVQMLMQHGLSSRRKNKQKLTPFCLALKSGNLEIIDCLLSYYEVQNIMLNDYNDIAPVYIAIPRGNLTVTKKYANSGNSINIPLKLNTNTWPCLYNYSGFTLLHFAVKHIKLEIVEFLLKKGADILAKNKYGSPLHLAFETKEKGIWKNWQDFDDNNSIIDLILEAHLKFNSNLVNKCGLSHFHIACSRDEPAIVEHFLKIEAPVNQPVNSQCPLHKKFPPLHFTAKFRCNKTMEVLLKNGADIKQKDYQDMTALHIAAKESCLETVSLLLPYGADIAAVDSHGKTPMHWAFENKSYKILDLLLSVPNAAISNPMDREGVSLFHIACTRNNVNVVKSFITNGVDLDACVPEQSVIKNNSGFFDWSGYSPLHFAVSHNKAKIVQLLLRSGANVEIKNSKGLTPFHLACQYTGEMFGEFIKNTLCNLSKRRKITQQLQPLTDIVSIDEKHANKFSGSIEKLDWSPHRKDYLKIINFLLKHGSDINSFDKMGNTTILYAYNAVMNIQRISKPNLDCSKDLLEQIVESLSTEIYERRKLILDHLMYLDVNLNECFKYGSILNCMSRNYEKDKESEEMAKLFLKRDLNVDKRNNEKMTPLLQAAMDDSVDLVKKLLESGANPNCIHLEDNSTPLLIAIFRMCGTLSTDVFKILIKNGANPNAKKSNGFTALHVACEINNAFALDTLLKHGADINIEDNAGRSVCCYFYGHNIQNRSIVEPSFNDKWMIKILQSHIAKMKVIGLPVSEKALSSNSKYDRYWLVTDEDKLKMIDYYEEEVQVLRVTKINDNYTLYDVIFKDENSLSQLVKNPAFEAIVKCELFEKEYIHYGYLIKLKYEAGVDRGNLLPKAKMLINQLAGMRLPEICSENISKYFNNFELKESLKILSGILNYDVNSSEDVQSISRKGHKRQRVD